MIMIFFFSSRRRHTRLQGDWSSDVCSSDLLVSGYAFHTTASNADRIAAQIVSGIGFIGGGAILKERGSIKGLTTAAGLWTAAALGMAAGAGLYIMGIASAVIILLTLA